MFRVVIPRVSSILQTHTVRNPLVYHRAIATMATPYKVLVTPENTGHLGIRQTPEAASTVSDLLQRDLDVSSLRHRTRMSSS